MSEEKRKRKNEPRVDD